MLTGSGPVLGSPGFMSPEQARGQRVGPPSDVFSLGALLTFAAIGQGPFGTAPSATLLYRVVFAPPDTTGLPTELRPLVERCLAKDPHQRPSTEQILTELNTEPPAPGWLPEPITQGFPSHPATEPSPGPALPPPATRIQTAGSRAEGGNPHRELAGAAVAAAALIIAYLVVALSAHLSPFSEKPVVPSSPATTTSAPSSSGPRPSPAVSSPSGSPATSPASSPSSSPLTSPASSPSSSPVTSPSASPSGSPSASPSGSPSSSVSGSPSSSVSGSPSNSVSGSPSRSASGSPSNSLSSSPGTSAETSRAGSSGKPARATLAQLDAP